MVRFLAILLLAAAPAVAAPWPAALTNPKPAAGDLTLPLPCEGALTLRPVEVPTSPGVLGDRAITLGQTDTQTPYADFTQRSFLAGAFGDPARGATRYFIGKYEITRDQYAAVTQPQCPAPTEAGSAPITGISWFDAVAFTAKLSSWWLANAKDKLPTRDGAPAFARLPTEEEWEFAARGGAVVDEATFRDPLPAGDPLTYAWLQGPRSAAARIRPVGRLAPNALGVFDMIGNAAEWVLEPFRLNKVGRPHGQVGGVVARGPHYLTDISQARTSLRLEYPPFNPANGTPLALPTIGMRIVLGTQASTTDARLAEVGRAFAQESGALTAQADDPVSLVARLRETAPDEPSRRALLEIEARLRTDNRGGLDAARLALRQRILRAATLGLTVRNELENSQVTEAIRDYIKTRQSLLEPKPGDANAQVRADLAGLSRDNQQIIASLEARLTRSQRSIAAYVRAYVTVVADIARSSGTLDPVAEATPLATELAAQGQPITASLARLAADHAKAAQAGRPPNPAAAEVAIGRAN